MQDHEGLTLVFIRHGEKFSEGVDRLTSRGKFEILSTGQQLKYKMNLWPDVILSSPTKRTKDSASLLQRVFEEDEKRNQPKIIETELLVEGSRGKFTSEGKGFAGLNDNHKTVFCVTHNNVIQSQFQALADRYPFIDYGTALVVKFNEKSWAEVTCDTKPKSVAVVMPEVRQ